MAFCFNFEVDKAHHGLRFDTFLTAQFRNHESSQFQRLAREHLVLCNDVPCQPDTRIQYGDRISVRLIEPPRPFYEPEPHDLEVLFEDPWLIAINKPPGVIVHPAGPVVQGTVANYIQSKLDQTSQETGIRRPGIVHRLDRDTSGVLLIPIEARAHANLTQQFESRTIQKVYYALLAGHLESNTGEISHPIGQCSDSLYMSCGPECRDPRPSRTIYHVIQRLRSTTLVQLAPHTGRKHQLRVHLAHIGHPILGDTIYGSTSGPQKAMGLALHAASIAFHHPVTQAPLRIRVKPPPSFWNQLARPI